MILEGDQRSPKRNKGSPRYNGLTNEDHGAISDGVKPIIIHGYPFPNDNYRLVIARCYDYDPSKNSDVDPQQWKTYFDDEWSESWIIIDDLDVEVNVTNSMFFRSLQPGESFVRHVIFDYLDLHPNTVPKAATHIDPSTGVAAYWWT